MLCANRVGKEDDFIFGGCSCTVEISPGKVNPVNVIGSLDKNKEGYLLEDIKLWIIYKMK